MIQLVGALRMSIREGFEYRPVPPRPKWDLTDPEQRIPGKIRDEEVTRHLLAGNHSMLDAQALRADHIFANTTGGRLISFDSTTPGTLQSNVGIAGVLGDLVGIDFPAGE